jgi:hypothetical protein
MTANHVEHEIATFPGSPGRGRRCVARRLSASADADGVMWPDHSALARQLSTDVVGIVSALDQLARRGHLVTAPVSAIASLPRQRRTSCRHRGWCHSRTGPGVCAHVQASLPDGEEGRDGSLGQGSGQHCWPKWPVFRAEQLTGCAELGSKPIGRQQLGAG